MSANCAPSQVEMDSAIPTMNPSPKSSSNVYHIGGIPVEFPYKPYGSQLAFMGRVISTLDRAQRQGHCHALLESPTGTGKSLSLLCSALAWQQNHRSKHLHADLSHSKPAPEALSDPLAYGGGFVPEPEPSGNSVSGALNSAPALTNKAQKKKTVPVIFYASRTHSQISQVVREYRKTSYRVRMAVLASRKHYCTNAHLCGKENIDEECKLLLKAPDIGCPEFKNAHKVKAHPSLEKGGCHEVHDIEDLVKIGRVVKGCSYFAARSLAEDADLVFCPYSYIISPTIRRAMEIDLKGAILILDEAHNIEDMARDAGSVDVEEDVLFALQTELGQLCLADALVYQPLYEMIQGIISWIGENKNKLEKREFQHHFSCWTGEKALRALQEAGISRQCFSILQECATKAIKATSEAESGGFYLTGTSAMSLEGLFSSFTYFFSGNGLHIHDYQLSLQRYVKRDARHAIGGWTLCFSLWCLNPAVVFRDIADLSMSVVLTSGTLAPMNSFSSELGVQFETCMEAPHVIDVESQLWAAVISNGPGNYPLNASYKTADGYAFQDALGASLEEICKIVPGGALVFFPSYKLMEKLCSRWQETDQWSRLNAQKTLFVEPRGSQDDFNLVLKSYYDSVSHGGRPVFGRNRKGKRRGLNNRISGTKSPQNPVKVGAAFLAVCRGKVSEGIDFSDENARVVIIVGIPFPNINDIQVALKKKYNDTYKSSKNLLSGNEWYCQQAFRALNQAAGRCIRHKFDYGAIIFIDERYREERNMAYVSKWLRKSIKKYDSFDTSLDGLKNFFQDVKEWVGQKGKTLLEASDISDENIPSTRQKQSGKASFGKKMQTVHQLDDCDRQELVSKDNKKGVYSSQYINSICENKTAALNQKAHGTVDVNQFSRTGEKDMEGCRDYIDLECSFEKDSRCLETFSVASSSDSQEISVVKETPVLGDDVAIASPEVSDKDDNSNSTIIQASKEITPEVSYKDDNSITCGPPNDTFSLAITPEKRASLDICNQKSEMCSYLNLSVNSHTQKRRKQIGLPLVDLVQLDGFGNPDEKPAYLDSKNSINGPTDANRRIEFGFKESYSECQYKNLNDLEYLKSNNCSTSCASSILVMDKRLCIRCSLCRNMLGLSENHFLVTCLLTTSSKTYLTSLLGSDLESPSTNRLKGVLVVISDISSVDPRVYKKTALENAREQDIWCEEDGCVFRTVFCPFCTASDKCLGLQIMACDSPNVHLLDKILFYFDCLEINNLEGPKAKDTLRGNGANVAELNSINKFSYLPQSQSSRGWRTTKSKLRRPKRGILSETEDQKNAEAGAPVDT